MRIVLLLLAVSCATSAPERSEPTWQDDMNNAIDRSREDERLRTGYYEHVQCPASAQPEWASASANDKHRMQVDCRLKATYQRDAGTN